MIVQQVNKPDGHFVSVQFDHYSTMKDIVERLVEDFNNRCEDLWDNFSALDFKVALLASLDDDDLADYHRGEVARISLSYGDGMGYNNCKDCGEHLGNLHDEYCCFDDYVVEEDCENPDDYVDLPWVTFEIELEDSDVL